MIVVYTNSLEAASRLRFLWWRRENGVQRLWWSFIVSETGLSNCAVEAGVSWLCGQTSAVRCTSHYLTTVDMVLVRVR